jgi:hypothetical protein
VGNEQFSKGQSLDAQQKTMITTEKKVWRDPIHQNASI